MGEGGSSSGSAGQSQGGQAGSPQAGSAGQSGSGPAGMAGSAGSTPTSECGNGALEAGEQCDTGDLGGKTCQSEGFGSGGLLCTANCTLDTSKCSLCGNNKLDPGEKCDGSNLGTSKTCADISAGTASEMLKCAADCTYDLSSCSGCGDGTITAPEECEPGKGSMKDDLGSATCQSLGFDGGNLACNSGCKFDKTGCNTCGDATKNGIEQCDGADFGGAKCSDFTASNGQKFSGGTLSCALGCAIDTSNCTFCGDGLVSGNEVCDGGNLNNKTCASQGFTKGTLACASNCGSFVTTGCSTCGNSQVETGEQCEAGNLAGATCTSLGFGAGGNLACSSSCTYDTSGCSNNSCGDGTVNGMDACDCGSSGTNCTSSQLNGKTCADFPSPVGTPFTGGTLGCFSPNNCAYDTSQCTYCGNGNIDSGETCDGNNLNGATCQSLGFSGGTLQCHAACGYNTSGCISVANPLTVCRTVNLAIPDNDGNGVTDSITVTSPGTITDVNLQVNINHAWVGDVAAALYHGTGDPIVIDQPGVPASLYGCSSANIAATLDDQAALSVENQCNGSSPAISGTYKPNNPLSVFNGQSMTGEWLFQAADLEAALTGTLTQWCVVISWQ
jgi:subtilisin-like proprotein convertase family protein